MRAKIALLSLGVALIGPTLGEAASWPTDRHSPTRNAVSEEALPDGPPVLNWNHQPAFGPAPAWHGPAKWDSYANLRGLHSMRGYDQTFRTIAVEDAVFYASTSEDCVRRLDAATGQTAWTFFADGPIRVAPSYDNGRLYFASDDGHAYCLDAETGELVWRHGVRADGRKVLNNGKLIPLWPIRTGVTVVDGTAYFAASLLPWRESYLVAVDAASGRELYRTAAEDATFEAPLVVSPRFVIAPQGRVAPLIFDRGTGKRMGQLSGGGGSFVVLTKEGAMMHGPGNKGGWITESDPNSREKLATHEAARSVVNTGGVTYFITDKGLVAIDYESKQRKWRTPFDEPLSLIAVGDALLVGGVNEVGAFDMPTGESRWRVALDGRVKSLAFADGRLLASLDSGAIAAIGFGEGEPLPAAAPLAPSKPTSPDTEDGFRVAVGPWLRYTSPTTAEVHWRTTEPSPSRLVWRDGADERQIGDPELKTDHRVAVRGLGLNVVYGYRLIANADGVEQTTSEYECDTFFNYTLAEESEGETNPGVADAVSRVLAQSNGTPGLAIVLGASDSGRFAAGLARGSQLRVIVFDPDAERVAKARQQLTADGLYGGRVVVLQATPDELAKTTDRIADVVACGSSLDGRPSPYPRGEFVRLASPNGYAVVPGDAADDAARIVQGQPIEGAADWGHVYGLPNNAAFAGESLSGAATTGDLAVQWIGRPGPRYQADRNGRKTPPLSAGGRLFLQGLDRVVAVDSYNGVIQWSIETPHFRRFNMPRDCGNWCTDGEAIFAAVRDRCWRIDGATGQIEHAWRVPTPEGESDVAWGYISRVGEVLLGSVTSADAAWTNYWGGEGWYDHTEGPTTHQVASHRLFGLDPESGEELWSSDRLILNSSVTSDDGVLYFAECRDQELKEAPNRRLTGDAVWESLHLVALEASTGSELWSRPLDDIKPGTVAFWMAATEGRLALVSSADVKFDVAVYDVEAGEQLWRREADWGKGKADHGTHLSRPAIVGGRLIVRPAVFEFETGASDKNTMPVSGCGTYACTTDAMFFRAWSGQQSAVWNPETGEYSRWSRLRPDCWLSTIPAGGLLLAPEGGGGCSCGSWLETSLAFTPKSILSVGAAAAEADGESSGQE